MRSFKNLFLLLISATLIIVFQGCNKSPTGSEGEDTDEIKLSENTVILADSTVNKIAQELGDSVIYFNKDAQEILQLEDGDVIVSSVGEGFLRKVKETKEEGDYIIVRTEYAALEDAINKGELSISDIKLDFQNMRIDYKRRGVRLKSRGDLLEVDFNTLLYEDPETGAEVQSFGRTLLGASIDTFGASFLFGLQSLKFGLEVYHSETLGVEISKACNFEGREKIASFTLSPFIVYVGIPIVITPHIDLYIGAALNVQGAVNSTICKDDTIVGGIVYNKGQGWSTYSDYKKYFSYALPSVSSSAEAKVYAIAPEISLQVYELIGPYAQMEGYGKIEVNPQATPWWILYGGFEVEGGVKMEILAWDVTWSGSIYSKEWELASAGGGTNTPPNTPSIPSGPNEGKINIEYTFTTSTTDPDGDNVAYQFDWGDGYTSSWSSYVSSGTSVSMNHSYSSAGIYSVKAKAKDVNGVESGWSSGHAIEINETGGNIWTQKADYAGGTISSAAGVGFSIGNRGYIGTGIDAGRFFWEYDPQTDEWTQKADFGGGSRTYSVGFSINGKGYIGTGSGGMSGSKDFWEYDTINDTWTRKADFPGEARHGAVGFSIGEKGYIGTGETGYISGDVYYPSYFKDFWEYDPQTDEWTQKADFPGEARHGAVGFSIGEKGYIGTGSYWNYSGYSVRFRDFWEYDPNTDTWSQKANFAGSSCSGAGGFSISDKGYIGTGYSGSYRKDLWEYDPQTDEWTQKADFPGEARSGAIGFPIGNRGYVGAGKSSSTSFGDFWEYDPGQ